MKRLYIISALLCCLALFAGCNKDSSPESEQGSKESVVLTMNIYNKTTRSNSPESFAHNGYTLGSAEYTIDRLRVYVFASDGSLDKMEIYDNLNADHIISQEIEVPKDLSKELYFVANEPEGLTEKLNGVTSAEELKDIDFAIASEMNNAFDAEATFSAADFLIPMSTTYSLKNALTDIKIYVGLTRAVARVELLLKKGDGAASRTVELNSSTLLSADGKNCTVQLFEGEIVDAAATEGISTTSSDVTLSSSTPKRIFSFYTAERTYSLSNPISIEIDGLIENGQKVSPKSVTLGDRGTLKEIKRNYIYQIVGSYNGEEIVAKDLTIMDWEDVEIDGEIEGVMVAVDSEVAMDWLLNGNSYTSKSISFGSNKPIELYLPTTISGEDDATPDYEFTHFEFEDMSAGASYDLKDIALTNNYIYATNWIEEATIHFTSDRSGYITFVYKPVKVSYKIQSYPIRIKSDNVTKQMKAVYDNGYLPASQLSDDWARRAPGGVIFAKRGEAKHPVSTPDILYRDDDGYYRGEYSTTAEEGTRYCVETFGKDWYMPSHADMVEIASMYDMLGVSYRFQNSGSDGAATEARYWTSSKSSEYPEYSWSANFTAREYMIDNLMERRETTESHFVRCVMDLQ